MKLRTRIALAYVALVAVSLVALAVYLNRSEQDRLRERVERDMASEARLVALAVGPLLADGAPAAEVDAAAKRLGPQIEGRGQISERAVVPPMTSATSPAAAPAARDATRRVKAMSLSETEMSEDSRETRATPTLSWPERIGTAM